MDGSQGQPAQGMVPPPQHSNLIRTDQVQKLPHLNDQQKAQHTQLVRGFWEILNTRDPKSPEYQTAQSKLSTLSQNLMKGMRLFQQNRQQALQAAQQGQPGQPGQRNQPNNPQSLNQLLPQIQAKVSALNFYLPPNVTPEQVQTWIPEARLRYGIALQKQEVGRARIAEMRQQFAQRQTQGNMTQEEVQEFKNRQLAAEKLFREGSEFLSKFKEQQESFKAQSHQNQPAPAINQPPSQTAAPATTPAATQAPNTQVGNGTSMQAGQAQTPAPHTVNSAVNAARNQAGQAMSPSTSQPGQAPSGTPSTAIPVPPNAQQTAQRPQPSSQQGTPGAQVTFSQTPNPDSSTPTPTPPGPQQLNQGPPRPLSHQAAIAQANANQQQTMSSTPLTSKGYLANRSTEASARNINMAIPKNLNVSTPEPAPMPPARPSLSGGPSHGAMGMMGQPAIQKHPGYVLEGEGQRLLSKKKLDTLVRQVTGGGEGEGLTPDAEEFLLEMADDFVDDVITQACRLAKLRPSSTLELRDIQLVLERSYNMRISGFATDDLRTVKKPQPTQGWMQKMSAIQAAKVTQGKTD
ncbi:hypothetical protein NUU61_000417 [Penicillium alfredii]|uniref:Transcription initiation factor TFIID subunit 12 domain-containing protein n=1 Tax=Penicillium alfredii TaxID=1506179 RepID=A0A9W9KR20_9EURO|nr:uncharacterized protein NUU61_000417 [Penicillium alfredii]KAJ5114658.1 hypothetical protein NUU61_000417 [Penicillium alfredii]